MAEGIHAHGSLLKDGSGQTLAKVNRINPSIGRDSLDTTSMDSTGAWRTGVPGLQGMTVNVEGNYIPDDPTHSDAATGILNKMRIGTAEDWVIEWKASTGFYGWTLPSYITQIDVDGPVDGTIDFTMQLQLTGVPTYAAIP